MRALSPKAPGGTAPALGAWHALPTDAALRALRADEGGLTSAEAAARLAHYGPNTLPSRPPPAFLAVFLHQFTSPLIYVLAVAAAVSAAIGELADAGFIAGVLILNAVIGTWQEWKAERGMQALQRYLQLRTTVIRDGRPTELEAKRLVPGDVVLVESGGRVPGDLRLLAVTGLEVDESLLTGESVPVGKDPGWTGDADTPLGDRENMLHAGSTVVRGRARGVVAETGARTAIGTLALEVITAETGKPPLLLRMERFTRVVAVTVLLAAAVIGGLGVLVRGYTLVESFMLVIALAVSAIPEGLPVGMTVALAVATSRMAQRSVIVRRLAAVEGLGSCTLIATDKTGTLTVNELTVREVRLPDGRRVEVTGEGFAPTGHIMLDGEPVLPGTEPSLIPLLRVMTLCNEATLSQLDDGWTWRGDPTDVALLAAGLKAGWEHEDARLRYPQEADIPFEPEHRFAATWHRDGDTLRVLVKGAPEKIVTMCHGPLDDAVRAATHMAESGLRVLAFAEAVVSEVTDPPAAPTGLTYLGLAGLIDPLRPGVAEAVVACRRAGIQVAMVTGDHPSTALAIARNLRMAEHAGEVATGADIQALDDAELADRVHRTAVFARVAPHQKLQIVRAAQTAGHFVAVTGDGVNDAPALRQSNVGVAMGKAGTDVARESSELVITDDNFASIVGGVAEGRIAYDNIRKVIYLLISTGAAELVLVALAVAFGTPVPLLPVQLLWLNLVTNGIQDVALAFEPAEEGVMDRKPRPPDERIFNRLMIERTAIGALVIGGVAYVVFHWLLASGMPVDDARSALLLLMVLFENVHIANCRSETRSAFSMSPLRSPILLTGTLTAFSVHVVAMYLEPLQRLLGAAPPPLELWGVLVACSLTVLLAMEIHKLTWRRRHPQANR